MRKHPTGNESRIVNSHSLAKSDPTTVLPAVTSTSSPTFTKTSEQQGSSGAGQRRWRRVLRRLIRVATEWDKADLPSAVTHVGMSIPDLIGRLGTAMLASQLPTSDIEVHLKKITNAYGRPDLRFVVLPTAILVGDPQTGQSSTFPLTSAPYRLHQASDTEHLMAKIITYRPEPEQAIKRLVAIEHEPPRFNQAQMILGHTLLTIGFGLVLTPTVHALPVYLVTGILAGTAIVFTRRRASAQVLLPALTSFLLTAAVLLTVAQFLPEDPIRLVTPALLAFLPGQILTVAAVELASNQVVAGASRLIYGIAQLGLLAFGVYAAWYIVGAPARFGTYIPLGPWAPWLGVLLTAAGFNLFMVAPKGALRWIFFVLLVVYLAQFIASFLVGATLAGFVGSLVLEPLSRGLQRFESAPTSVVLRASGYFLLVPGALGFIGISEAASNNSSLGLLLQVFVSLLSIGLGTLVGASITRNMGVAVRTWHDPDLMAG